MNSAAIARRRTLEEVDHQRVMKHRYPDGWELLLCDAQLVYEIVDKAMTCNASGSKAQLLLKTIKHDFYSPTGGLNTPGTNPQETSCQNKN